MWYFEFSIVLTSCIRDYIKQYYIIHPDASFFQRENKNQGGTLLLSLKWYII